MSESKAQLRATAKQYEQAIAELRGDVVFLLQALWEIYEQHPEVDQVDLGNNRFPEWVWRQVV